MDAVIPGLPVRACSDTGQDEEQGPCIAIGAGSTAIGADSTAIGAGFTGPVEEFASQPAKQHMGFNHGPNQRAAERPRSY